MTENESKAFLEIEKQCINRNCDRNCAKCDIVQKVEDLNSAYDTAIKALEEVQQYRELGTVEELVQGKKYINLAKQHGTIGRVIENCIAYEEIGTPEECRKNKDFLQFLSDRMPTYFEMYLRMYNVLKEKGCDK